MDFWRRQRRLGQKEARTSRASVVKGDTAGGGVAASCLDQAKSGLFSVNQSVSARSIVPAKVAVGLLAPPGSVICQT